MLGNKPSLNTFKKIGFAKYMFYKHNVVKLEINRRKTGKFINIWKLTFFNNLWIKEEITKEIRKYLEVNESKNTVYQNRRYSESSVYKKIYSCKFLY